MLSRKLNILHLIVAVLLFSGCAAPKVQMYSGPPVAANKQATLRVDFPARGIKAGAEITHIDGESTINFFQGMATAKYGAGTVYLLPGKHTVSIRHGFGNSYAFGNLWFIAKAGASYKAISNIKGYGVSMWIVDEKTGKPVGGVVGSADEPKGK